MKDFLFTEQGRQYLQEEYVSKERSTYDLAKERGTYANKVRRALIHHGFRLRDKGKAQEAALKAGRHTHPTRGRKRTELERKKISDAMRANHTVPDEGEQKTDE